jgi:folate-binding protein YgfZ
MAPGLIGYEAARTKAAYYRHPDAGYVRVAGPDRLDFLQRQMTNDVKHLKNGGAMVSVLTSPNARILDVWLMLAEEDAVGLIPLPGRAETTAQYLQSRIFFMDNVSVSDSSADYAQFSVEGPDAPQLLSELGVSPIPSLDQKVAGQIAGVGGRVVGQRGLVGDGFRILVNTADGDTLAESLNAADAPALVPDTYEVLRVEAGIPGPLTELTDDYTPLETNLAYAISDSKGCYTGQEVIARQVTYDRITQRLMGLRFDGQAAAGDSIRVEGKRAGGVTSTARSPRFGLIGLGIIRRPYHEAGMAVTVLTESGQVKAQVVALPFQ